MPLVTGFGSQEPPIMDLWIPHGSHPMGSLGPLGSLGHRRAVFILGLHEVNEVLGFPNSASPIETILIQCQIQCHSCHLLLESLESWIRIRVQDPLGPLGS